MSIENLTIFIGQNYFWILIITIVLIMALIGFLADKNNLVKINKKEVEKENQNVKDVLIENMNGVSLQDAVKKSSTDNNEFPNDLTIPLENENTIVAPEDLTAPLENTNITAYDTAKVETINGMEIVNLDEVDSNIKNNEENNMSTVDIQKDDETIENPIEIDLPDLNETTDTEMSQDDIWKF